MRWAGYVARMETPKVHTLFWLENLKGRDHSKDLVVDGKVILELILGN
jgi:hypothetical protein